MASEDTARNSASAGTGANDTSTAGKDSGGTEVRVLTFTHSEDAVVPDGWEIQNVEYDRSMAVTRVTVLRPYDAERNAQEREDAAGPSATPTYPQPAGGVPSAPEPPVTSFAWGSIDTSKVQNQETVAAMPPSIAAQEADTAQAPSPEALVDEVKANDQLEDKTAVEASTEGGNVEDSETLKAAAEVADSKTDAPSEPSSAESSDKSGE